MNANHDATGQRTSIPEPSGTAQLPANPTPSHGNSITAPTTPRTAQLLNDACAAPRTAFRSEG